MRIAIVHYHLRPGGVTRVIAGAQQALRGAQIQLATIAGSKEADAFMPELEYAPKPVELEASEFADRLEAAARTALGGAPDIWHIHNHSLGRHPSATAAFAELARRGHRLLLQIHDFAEDGRPGNYRFFRERFGERLPRLLYPAASHVHYAALNPRDQKALALAGVPTAQLHSLPNPVLPPGGVETLPISGDPALVLYPTRAIRRKNIGEFLLWSALETEGRRFALTLAPTSPSDVAPYENWKSFTTRLGLPSEFEAGLKPGATLPDLLARSALVATTSVAEGFGLAFTEPWLANRSLAGRALPEITADLTAGGLCLDALYERLDVPLAWIGEDRLRARIGKALRTLADSYDEAFSTDATATAWHSFVHGDRVDFGRLDEPLQQEIIERIWRDESARDAVSPKRLLPDTVPDRRAENRKTVNRLCSLSSYSERLAAVYRAVASSPTGPLTAHEADAVRRFFLDPARLFLLRCD